MPTHAAMRFEFMSPAVLIYAYVSVESIPRDGIARPWYMCSLTSCFFPCTLVIVVSENLEQLLAHPRVPVDIGE